jgi:hypothetical protein
MIGFPEGNHPKNTQYPFYLGGPGARVEVYPPPTTMESVKLVHR